MSANPLMLTPRHDLARNLETYVEEVNRCSFVRDSGRPYFVNQRHGPDGVPIRFIDRNG